MNTVSSDKLYNMLPTALLPWYKKNARRLPWRNQPSPYQTWISEIMLQQTRVDTVIDYYNRFLAALPDVHALANAPEEKVLKLWEGLGYYSRARNLHKAAKKIQSCYGGIFPNKLEDIRSLPGIGAYTAGAIASIAFEMPVPAIDGNVLRVISRITEDSRCIDSEQVKGDIAARLEKVYPKAERGNFTQSLMELGATVCLPKGVPLCNQCPASSFCLAYNNATISQFPVRSEKKPRKIQEKTFLVLQSGADIALTKTAAKGVLHNLWALPSVDALLSKEAAAALLDSFAVAPYSILSNRKGKHIFTHIEWQIVCYQVFCSRKDERFFWHSQEALHKEISLPTAFRKFLPKN